MDYVFQQEKKKDGYIKDGFYEVREKTPFEKVEEKENVTNA